MPSLRVCQPAPCVRGARARAGWRGAAVWLLVLGGCGPTPAAPTSPSTVRVEYPEFVTYTGEVVQPYPSRFYRPDGTGGPRGLAGVRVTIVGGQPHGRTAVTDAAGRFEFADYPFCPLYTAECQSRRFRAEKAGYETREVGASDLFYTQDGGLNGRSSSAEYKRIFMGRAWPPDPRLARMRRELPAMKDIWLVELAREGTSGSYIGRRHRGREFCPDRDDRPRVLPCAPGLGNRPERVRHRQLGAEPGRPGVSRRLGGGPGDRRPAHPGSRPPR